MATADLEMVDTENLRPHYARTLWGLVGRSGGPAGEALAVLQRQSGPEQAGRALRAYRLYLAGSAMGFERGWMALHQMVATRPMATCTRAAWSGRSPTIPSIASPYIQGLPPLPLQRRDHGRTCTTMLYKFKSRATADVIMLEANGRQLLQIIGKSPDPHGIVTAAQIPAALQAWRLPWPKTRPAPARHRAMATTARRPTAATHAAAGACTSVLRR